MIAPLPSTLAGRDSNVTTCSCCNRSSAASSIVTIRSVAGMNEDNTFRVVVLPEPVPPDTRIFNLAWTHAFKKSAISRLKVPNWIKFSTDITELANFLIVTHGPFKDNGGMMIFTRDPSAKRASTNGEASSILRPSGRRILSMIFIK